MFPSLADGSTHQAYREGINIQPGKKIDLRILVWTERAANMAAIIHTLLIGFVAGGGVQLPRRDDI